MALTNATGAIWKIHTITSCAVAVDAQIWSWWLVCNQKSNSIYGLNDRETCCASGNISNNKDIDKNLKTTTKSLDIIEYTALAEHTKQTNINRVLKICYGGQFAMVKETKVANFYVGGSQDCAFFMAGTINHHNSLKLVFKEWFKSIYSPFMQPITNDDCSVLCKCDWWHWMPLQNGRAWPRKFFIFRDDI